MGYYIFQEDNSHRRIEGRYWNPGIERYPNLSIGVIASITKKPSGEPFDWAAYIGTDPTAHNEETVLKTIAQYGTKLSENDARHFFPDIAAPYRK